MLKRYNTMMLENIIKEETRKKIYKNFDKVKSNKVELMKQRIKQIEQSNQEEEEKKQKEIHEKKQLIKRK